MAPGQFGTGQFDTGQFGTRTIWHRIDKRAILHQEIIPKQKCSLLLYVGPGAHLIFLADAVNIVRGEFLSCREILNVKNSQMRTNFGYGEFL